MIIGIFGSPGSGKSCMLTRLAILQKELNPDKKLFTNYKLYGVDYENLDIEYLYTENIQLKNIIICATEIYTFMDARVSGKKENRAFSYLIAQMRKKSCDLFFDEQFERFSDLRLSLFVDVRIIMENNYLLRTRKVNDIIYRVKEKHPYLFNMTIIDGRDTYENCISHKRFDGRPWFDRYDTEEIILPNENYIKKTNTYK